MKKVIMLACAGGMSTSLLVTKMREEAKKRNLELEIFATAGNSIPQEYDKHQPNVVLLGPQVRFMLNKVKEEVNVPVSIIDMQDYGTMNGPKVLDLALSLIEEK